MALTVNGNTDYVIVTDDASFQDQSAFSVLVWLNRSADQEGYIFRKGAMKAWSFTWADTDELEVSIERAGVDASARTNTLAIGTASWEFCVVTYDETDGTRIFHGDLSTSVSEAGYAFRVVGDGATSADNGNDLYIANRDADDARHLAGDHATFQWINRRLTLGEIRQLQYRPHIVPDTQIFFHFGYNGTGTQPDLSGTGNNGTGNNVTVADHVPLGPFFGWDISWLEYTTTSTNTTTTTSTSTSLSTSTTSTSQSTSLTTSTSQSTSTTVK